MPAAPPPLGALGSVTHHQHRLAKAWCLLLNAARVSEYQVARRKEVVEVQRLERIDNVQPVEAVKLSMRRLAHEQVHVDRVDRLGVGALFHHAADCAEHTAHWLA